MLQSLQEWCSTPSGITASGTLERGLAHDGRVVLNAFRHHGERDLDAAPDRKPQYGCSTPSGITASGTRPSLGARPWDRRVLNAFRHHGERDIRDGRLGIEPLGVCSTPSGITASGTCWCLRKEFADHVLNAFRHHGERDKSPGSSIWKLGDPCSTPSGITASGTPSVSRRRGSRRTGVLNAFRHHGERDSVESSVRALPGGAQRLPASRRAGQPVSNPSLFCGLRPPPFMNHIAPSEFIPVARAGTSQPIIIIEEPPFKHLFTCQRTPTPRPSMLFSLMAPVPASPCLGA